MHTTSKPPPTFHSFIPLSISVHVKEMAAVLQPLSILLSTIAQPLNHIYQCNPLLYNAMMDDTAISTEQPVLLHLPTLVAGTPVVPCLGASLTYPLL